MAISLVLFGIALVTMIFICTADIQQEKSDLDKMLDSVANYIEKVERA